MKNELKPCPFCGSCEIEILGANRAYCAHCAECGAVLPVSRTKKQAADAWNKRADAARSAKPLAWEYEGVREWANLPKGAARLFIEKDGDPPHYSFGIEIEDDEISLDCGFLDEEDAKNEAQMWLDNFARAIMEARQ